MKTEIMKITPVMAENILEKAVFKNRRLKQRHIDNLALQMMVGKWRFTGESIKFNNKMGLIDGQHRLRAVIKSNTIQEFLAVTGLSEEIFKVIDTGKNRTAGDALFIKGVKNEGKIASIIRSYVFMGEDFFGGLGGNTGGELFESKSNENILNEFNKRPDYWINLKNKSGIWYKSYQHLLGHTTIGGLYAMFNERTNDKEVDEFFTTLCNMNFGANPNNPQKKLTKLLLQNSMSVKKYKSIIIKALVIKTWNAFYLGKDIKTLKYKETDNFPEILPKNNMLI